MSEQRSIYLATKNRKKIKELQAMLPKHWLVKSFEDIDQSISWEETGTTFEENARIKVDAVSALVDGLVLGDDSGLEVDALEGAPGVYSSRYCGEEGNDSGNNKKLLTEIADIPQDKRQARFVCCLCFLDRNKTVHYFKGYCEGAIGDTGKGTNGFGYDPIFYPDGGERSLAEYSSEEKNSMSHRAKALELFLEHIKAIAD